MSHDPRMKNDLFRGVTLSLLGTLLYASMNAVFKAEATALPPLPVVIFIQSLVSFILMTSMVLADGGIAAARKNLATTRLWLHVLRALTSLTIMFSLYYSIQYIPLVNALLLSNSAPLIVPFIGYAFFSEKINHRLWAPVLIGYAGVAIVLNPDSHFFEPAALYAVISAVALAFTIQIVRKLTATDSTSVIMFYFMLFTTLFSGLISIPFWQPLSLVQCGVLLLIGILYFTSQFLGNASMRYGNPQLISGLMYANVLYGAIISVFVWGMVPTVMTWIGIVLVMIGGIACIWVEHIALKRARYLTI